MTENPPVAVAPVTAPPKTSVAGRWIKRLAACLAVLVVALGILVATQPNSFRIERSLVVAAPQGQVFDHIQDFRKWEAWSPWAKLDPEAQNSFSGPESGVGAIFKWSGNDQVGEGQMEILACEPPQHVQIELVFIRPYEDRALVDFQLQEAEQGTQVSWIMSGQHNVMSKIMCLFMDLDAMVGGDFERGLASLKTVVEADLDAATTGTSDVE